ncbi:hypothetical protein [Persephonella sp.]|uniref:hypothetical protein n=1 Tax=Persephonella sp. TaxID=2060922 RepID=UPI0026220F57|nr:hypothetical protein [Persephonella sp.]
MQKLKTKEEPKIKFDQVEYQCRCSQKGKEIILVANNTGVLDITCPKCNRRLLEIRIFDFC